MPVDFTSRLYWQTTRSTELDNALIPFTTNPVHFLGMNIQVPNNTNASREPGFK